MNTMSTAKCSFSTIRDEMRRVKATCARKLQSITTASDAYELRAFFPSCLPCVPFIDSCPTQRSQVRLFYGPSHVTSRCTILISDYVAVWNQLCYPIRMDLEKPRPHSLPAISSKQFRHRV